MKLSMITILLTLGIGLMFDQFGWEASWYSSGLGAHLTWTLPFGLLIMSAVSNRFDQAFEEAARDLGISYTAGRKIKNKYNNVSN